MKEMINYYKNERNTNTYRHAIATEKVLMCPGPVMVSNSVQKSLEQPVIWHRGKDFSLLLKDVREMLTSVFDGHHEKYTSIVLNGSGTVANESLISSYKYKGVLAIISNGEFGNRLIKIAKDYSMDVIEINFGWGNPVDISKLKEIILTENLSALMMVHHETSTGMINPVTAVGDLLLDTEVDFLVDAVSSLGSEKISVQKDNITYCTSSSNKALASLPGLSFICGKRESFKSEKKAPSSFLNLYDNYKSQEYHEQTLNTPSVNLYFALKVALLELIEESTEKRIERTLEYSKIIRNRINQNGTMFLIPLEHMSNTLTVVKYPDTKNTTDFHEYLYENGYIINPCRGPYQDIAYQIANIGDIEKEDINILLDLIENYEI